MGDLMSPKKAGAKIFLYFLKKVLTKLILSVIINLSNEREEIKNGQIRYGNRH